MPQSPDGGRLGRARPLARDAALILFAAIGAYLLSLPLSARLALLFAKSAVGSPVGGVLLALVALDLAKLPTLLVAAWLFGRGFTLRPATSAAALVLVTYTLELAVTLLLGETRWLGNAGVLLSRGAAMFVLIFVVGLVVKRVSRPSNAAEAGPNGKVAADEDSRDNPDGGHASSGASESPEKHDSEHAAAGEAER